MVKKTSSKPTHTPQANQPKPDATKRSPGRPAATKPPIVTKLAPPSAAEARELTGVPRHIEQRIMREGSRLRSAILGGHLEIHRVATIHDHEKFVQLMSEFLLVQLELDG